MYKLVAIDCDGTLLTDDKQLTEKTIETIKRAKSKVKIVIATARAFYRVEEYLQQMDLLDNNQYTICFNGGCVVNNGTQEYIEKHNFRTEEVQELIALSKKFKTQILLYGYDCLILEEMPVKFKNNTKINFKITKIEELDISQYIIYKIVFINEPEKILEMRKELPEEVLEKYEVTSSVPDYIEFVPKGITKHKALEKLCNKLGIEKNEVIAIGDAENDIKMIEFARMGIAMGNADDITKSVANDITDSNNNDGVAKAIEKYIE